MGKNIHFRQEEPVTPANSVATNVRILEAHHAPAEWNRHLSLYRPGRLNLVLDNCEHVLDACAHFADALLKKCPHVRVLASSREGLGIAGETVTEGRAMTMEQAIEYAMAEVAV